MSKRRNFRFDDATEKKLQSLMIAWDLDATGVLKRLIAEAVVQSISVDAQKRELAKVLSPFTEADGVRNAARANTLQRTIQKPDWKTV